MNIPADQISYKRRIGKLDGRAIWEIGLRGGLHLVVKADNGKAETLGVGPHRAVARHIALKREPGIEITELSKSDEVPLEAFAQFLGKYEDMTTAFRRARGYEV